MWNGRDRVDGERSVFAVYILQNHVVTPEALDMSADSLAGSAMQRHAFVHAMGQE